VKDLLDAGQYTVAVVKDACVNKGTWPWLKSGGLSPMSDAQLLYRYAQLGEGSAFQFLMKRHGPLVWGVCRRLLHCDHDADDAFQATFLVLSKKASSLRNPQALPSWLYGVAHRISRKVRSRKRYHPPLEAAPEPMTMPADMLLLREQSLLMDEAVLALPGELRNVFLLCEVEELTAQAAAHRLNIPEGTVSSRLHRARRRLQGLLRQRGITSAVSASALLGAGTIPEALAAHATQSILTSTTTASIQALAYGALTTMFWMKCSAVLLATVSIGIAGAGATSFMAQGSGESKATAAVATVVPLDDKDRRIKELEAKLQQMEKLAMDMRDQVARARQEQEAVQRFLKQQLTGEEEKKTQIQRAVEDAKEQERKAREAEVMARKMALRQEEERAQKLRQWTEAKSMLEQEVEHLSKQVVELEALVKRAAEQERILDRARQILDRYEDQLRTQQENSTDTAKTKSLTSLRDKLRADVEQQQSKLASQPVPTTAKARLDAQIKLREKLLLEAEERILRQRMQLDGK
jgi:RNA polymerase sigma factor (sigma-70 family)